MYYVVSSETGQIIDAGPHYPDDPQETADYFKCPVYFIAGQQIGIVTTPTPPAPQSLLEACKKFSADHFYVSGEYHQVDPQDLADFDTAIANAEGKPNQ